MPAGCRDRKQDRFVTRIAGTLEAVDLVDHDVFGGVPHCTVATGQPPVVDRELLGPAGIVQLAHALREGVHGSGHGSTLRRESGLSCGGKSWHDAARRDRRGAAAGDVQNGEDGSPYAHEIGHTIHWPHSFFGPGDEYDNPTDMMSELPIDSLCGFIEPGVEHPCLPNNTLAFNRFAAGWIDDSQVPVHDGGGDTIVLEPAGTGGLQMLAAPDPANSRVMLTLEARPDSGADVDFPHGGVAAFIIDQRPHECPNLGPAFGACISTDRRQAPAIGVPHSYDHLLAVGTTTVIDGITVTVSSQVGETFTVSVSGSFTAPASLPSGSGIP